MKVYRHEDYDQLKLEMPFGVTLREDNRWVILSKKFPWEEIDREYREHFKSSEGQVAIPSRLAFGALYIQAEEGYFSSGCITANDTTMPKSDFPKDFVSFTTEESETIAQYQSDIDTYVTESLAKLITGDLDVDKDYDAFVSQPEAMNAGEIKNIYQTAYDRFMA